MNTLSVALYFFAASIGVFCFLLLLVFRRQLQLFPDYLNLYIALQAMKLLVTLAMHSSLVPATLLWLFLLSILSFTSAPLVLLYAKKQTDALIKPSFVAGSLQWGLLLTGFLLCSPLLMVELAGIGQWLNLESALFWDFYYVSLTTGVGLYILQTLIMLRVALPPLKRIKGESLLTLHNIPPRRAVFKILLWATVLQTLVNVLRAAQCRLEGLPSLLSLTLSVVDVTLTLGIIVALILVMLKETLALSRPDQTGKAERVINKYQRSVLSDADSQRIKTKLVAALNNTGLMFDNRLNLGSFSQALNEKPHYVSQVINQHLNNNFFDLINDTRVDYSCELLRQQPNWSIIDIAMQVGFNAKSTFYKAFTKRLGCTPAHYKKSLINSKLN